MVCISPAPERKRERERGRERERERVTLADSKRTREREKRGENTDLTGPKLKGQPKLDRSPKATNLFTLPKQDSGSLTRCQTQKQHSFEKNTAGWRGPWAAPPLWRVAPGDLGTEEPKLPHQGNRPRKRNSIQDAKTQLGPQRVVLPLSPLFYRTTRGTSCRQDRTVRHYHTLSQTRSASSQANLPDTETRKRGFQGKPRGGGQTPSPLCLISEIASDLWVRDGHRNRKSQKSLRFRCAKVMRHQMQAWSSAPCLFFLTTCKANSKEDC